MPYSIRSSVSGKLFYVEQGRGKYYAVAQSLDHAEAIRDFFNRLPGNISPDDVVDAFVAARQHGNESLREKPTKVGPVSPDVHQFFGGDRNRVRPSDSHLMTADFIHDDL